MMVAALVADATGGPRIDGGRKRRPGGRVLYLAAEESLGASIVPRLRAAGAVLPHVYFGPLQEQDGRCWRPQLPTDLPALTGVLRGLRPALVVLEPLVSFFGERFDWRRDQDAHAVLDPVVLLAADMGAAVLGVRHWTKAASGPVMARGMGSRAVSGCAAVVIQLARQDNRADRFVMAAAKYRIGPSPESRSYSIAVKDGAARFVLGPPLSLRVDELQRSSSLGASQKLLAARQLLRHKLADGWKPAAELVLAAKRDGVSDTVLYEAKALDKVQNRWNTRVEPKRSEWGPPKGGFEPLDGT